MKAIIVFLKDLLIYVCIYLFTSLFIICIYEYTVAVLMVVSHHVVAGNLNSGPLLALFSLACSSLKIYLSTL